MPTTLAGGKETFKAPDGQGKSVVRRRAPGGRRGFTIMLQIKEWQDPSQTVFSMGQGPAGSRQRADVSLVGSARRDKPMFLE